jgi:hypothetical protein
MRWCGGVPLCSQSSTYATRCSSPPPKSLRSSSKSSPGFLLLPYTLFSRPVPRCPWPVRVLVGGKQDSEERRTCACNQGRLC